jgi:hypothetical protein
VDTRLAFSIRIAVACLFAIPGKSLADEPRSADNGVRILAPYAGASNAGVDCSTLLGKVVCGYQGWFAAAGDGSQRGWRHYPFRGRFEPGSCTIDLWPDVTDLTDEEKFATPFRHADGGTAYVFSSFNRRTVLRHFEWMRRYGIEAVFVQRFAVETLHDQDRRHANVVLTHCREGANLHGRAYAVMYDLSGLRGGGVQAVIDDWKMLVDKLKIGRDANDRAYLHHNGRPLVAVWGIGFNDGRTYSLLECKRLFAFLKRDPDYGGCTLMAGVPTGWQTLDADSVKDETLHKTLADVDIVSPWTVGRYATLEQVEKHAQRRWRPDLQWCRQHKKQYLPVVFPGFSWHNGHPPAPLNQIPRREGKFLWRQFAAAKRAGAAMIYVAMFDEMDEGTAIFKCTNDPPVGASPFVTFAPLPTDHYLWLTGMGQKLLRGEIEASDDLPGRHRAAGKKANR